MTKRFLLEDGTEIFAPDDAVLTSDGLIYSDQEHKSSRPMTDKHQALLADRDSLVATLRMYGFVRCDIAACNCGSWHARYGLPERFQEIKDALTDAGYPLRNENGNLVKNALGELIADRDRMRAALERISKRSDACSDESAGDARETLQECGL